MTNNQITTTATPTTTALNSSKAPRKATKDQDDSAADQFAAMLASLCLAPMQVQPAAKPKEGAAADGALATETVGADGKPPVPVMSLEALANSKNDVPLLTEAAPILPPTTALEASLVSPAVPLPETITPPPVTLLTPTVTKPTPETNSTDPLPTVAKSTELPVAPDQLVVTNAIIAEQTIQAESVRREANLVAGYLANTMRHDREGTAAVKTLLAGNGFDLRGGDSERDSDVQAKSQFSTVVGGVSFASTVRDLQQNSVGTSIQSQTINHIIAQADELPARQMRSVRLRLRPEELGQIDIQLSRDAAGRISAHITAERESARVALSRSLDDLRDTLSKAGLTVDKLQINAETGLSAGHRESSDAGFTPRESSAVAGNALSVNETEAGGIPRAEDEKLLSLHA